MPEIWDSTTETIDTAPATGPALQPLERTTFALVHDIADSIAGSTNLPQHGRARADAIVLMLSGQELGIPPMQALRSLHLVEGRVELSATLMLGLMASKMGCQFTWQEATAQQAVLVLKRPDQQQHTERYTWAMAERAGLTRKKNWQQHPEAMLRARCISAAARAYCPEILSGCYVEGELDAGPAMPQAAGPQPLAHPAKAAPATITPEQAQQATTWAAGALGVDAATATRALELWSRERLACWGPQQLDHLRVKAQGQRLELLAQLRLALTDND